MFTALATPEARPIAAMPIIDEFQWLPRHDAHGVWVAAVSAPQVVAGDSVLDDILRLIAEPGRPVSAQRMLIRVLGNMTRERAATAFIALREHPGLVPYAIDALILMPVALAAPARLHLDHFIDVYEPTEELRATR